MKTQIAPLGPMQKGEEIEVNALDLIKEYESDQEEEEKQVFPRLEIRGNEWYWWINKSVGFYEKK